MRIQNWPIERPIPYARNPRTIPDRAIEKVASSIAAFGWRQPIVVDQKGVVVVSHVRLFDPLPEGDPRLEFREQYARARPRLGAGPPAVHAPPGVRPSAPRPACERNAGDTPFRLLK